MGARSGGKRTFWTRERLLSPSTVLIVAVALLCAIGLVEIFSITSVQAIESSLLSLWETAAKEGVEVTAAQYDAANLSIWSDVLKQALFVGAFGVVAYVVFRLGGDRWLGSWAVWLWGLFVVLLLALLIYALIKGYDEAARKGAIRWFDLGFATFQPSELAKITVLMMAAKLFAQYGHGDLETRKLLLLIGLFVVFPLVLILLEKDLGTIIIIGIAVLFMAYLAGIDLRFIGIVLGIALLAVLVLILSSDYRRARLLSYVTTPSLDPSSAAYYGDSWQIAHSLFALATGGFTGVGLGNSTQKYSWLPDARNDFIFAIIGEELGFLGCLGVILLFGAIGWAGFRIARRARERGAMDSSLLVFGLTTLLLVQAVLNMGGVVGLLPLTGRPLPFVSYGGSSMLSSMIMIGLMVGIERDNELAERSRYARPQLEVINGRGGY